MTNYGRVLMKQLLQRKVGPAVMLLALVAAGATTARSEEAPRSPFQVPARKTQAEARDYARALRQVTLRGILCADGFSRAMVQIGGGQAYVAFKKGQAISLDMSGIPHEFRVTGIREKSVVFTDKNNDTHEVCLP